MATKSNVSVYLDDDAGTSIQFQSDASGYMQVLMSDGKNTVSMKLSATNAHTLRNAMAYGDALRSQIPQS